MANTSAGVKSPRDPRWEALDYDRMLKNVLASTSVRPNDGCNEPDDTQRCATQLQWRLHDVTSDAEPHSSIRQVCRESAYSQVKGRA